ncbi:MULTISPECIES: hypothetical protein [Nocardia]|uniref:hypothetical protein n=1 Tax=Nocardia TaxID=1817 RepID=UPI0024542FE4|nr:MULTISPECIES: hypothetical protein [Nocardia]
MVLTNSEWPPVPMWSQRVPGQVSRPPLVWLLGAHGGAGTTALASSLSYAGDAHRRWPGLVGIGRDLDSPFVVVVGRTHMSGLAAVHHALLSHAHQATPTGVRLLGMITVADSDRPLSKPTATRRDTVEALARDLHAVPWRLGWIEPWRTLEPHELPAWTPDHPRRVGERDPTRVPPAPVAGLAEQLFTTARAAVTQLRQQPPTTNRSGRAAAG